MSGVTSVLLGAVLDEACGRGTQEMGPTCKIEAAWCVEQQGGRGGVSSAALQKDFCSRSGDRGRGGFTVELPDNMLYAGTGF